MNENPLINEIQKRITLAETTLQEHKQQLENLGVI